MSRKTGARHVYALAGALALAWGLHFTPWDPFPSLGASVSGHEPVVSVPVPRASKVEERVRSLIARTSPKREVHDAGRRERPSVRTFASTQESLEIPCIEMKNGTCTRHALDSFYRALLSGRKVRVALWSDSLMAGGLVWRTMSSRLKKLWGDGGPGFVQPGRLHDWERNPFCTLSVHGHWLVRSILKGALSRHEYGFGGLNLLATGPGERLVFRPATGVNLVMLHVVTSQDGGKVRVVADGAERVSSTRGVRKTSMILMSYKDRVRHVTVESAGGGPVRLLGVYLEKDEDRGVVLDGAGITGARFTHLASVSDESRRVALSARRYALLVYSFGRNEVDVGITEEYAATVQSILERDRAILPDASCLVLGPTDQSEKKNGRIRSRREVALVREALHTAAVQAGCAFMDLQTLMGGEASSYAWYRKGLMWADLQHLTPKGGEVLGSLVVDDLLAPLVHAFPRLSR